MSSSHKLVRPANIPEVAHLNTKIITANATITLTTSPMTDKTSGAVDKDGDGGEELSTNYLRHKCLVIGRAWR